VTVPLGLKRLVSLMALSKQIVHNLYSWTCKLKLSCCNTESCSLAVNLLDHKTGLYRRLWI